MYSQVEHYSPEKSCDDVGIIAVVVVCEMPRDEAEEELKHRREELVECGFGLALCNKQSRLERQDVHK